MSSHGAPITLPEGKRLLAWRAACVAYRAARREGYGDLEASSDARDAILKLHPELPAAADAQAIAITAVAYAAANHPKWFWAGVGG